MIELTPAAALIVYLGITLAILFAVWIVEHLRSRNKPAHTSEEALLVCEYCHYAYLSRAPKAITQCPQCQSLNKIAKRQRHQ